MKTEDGNFVIKYENNSMFEGNLFKKDWRKISDKKNIKELMFVFGNKSVKLENFQSYNITNEVWGVFGQKQQLVNITIAGRAADHTVLIIYDMKSKTVIRKKVDHGCEYGNLISSTWKRGIEGRIPMQLPRRNKT